MSVQEENDACQDDKAKEYRQVRQQEHAGCHHADAAHARLLLRSGPAGWEVFLQEFGPEFLWGHIVLWPPLRRVDSNRANCIDMIP